MPLKAFGSINGSAHLRKGAMCFVLSWLFFVSARSQDKDLHALWFHSLSGRGVSPNSYNWYVYHDSEGFVWISSMTGLNRFDGYNIKEYYSFQEDTTSLLGENIYSDFFEDNKKNIWFSTTDAIHSYQRKDDNFRRFFIRDGDRQKITGEYRVFYLERERYLWVKVGKDVYKMDIFQPYLPAQRITTSEQFKCRFGINADKSVAQLYMFGGENGVEVHSVEDGILCSKELYYKDAFVREVLPRNDRAVWLSVDSIGLILWNPKSLMPPQQPINKVLKGTTCTMTGYDENHLLVLTAGKKMFLMNENGGDIEEINCGIIHEEYNVLHNYKSATIDENRNLWVPDITRGVYFANLNKVKLKSLPFSKALNPSKNLTYWAFAEDEDGNVWQATNPFGIIVSDKNGIVKRHFMNQSNNPNSIPSNVVTDVVFDKGRNRIWIATPQGLAWCAPATQGTFHKIVVEKGNKNTRFKHLFITKSGKILVTTEGDGMFEIVEHKGKTTLVQVKLTEGASFQTIFEDINGNLYCERDAAIMEIFRYENNLLTLKKDPLKIRGLVNGFLEDKQNNNYWFGTSEGLVKLDKKFQKPRLTYYTTRHGLPGNFIAGIEADPNGNIWISTNKGIASFKGDNLDNIRLFTLADGTLSTEFHPTASLKKENGEIWFGGSNGITIIPANIDFSYKGYEPKVQITQIGINGEPIDSSIRCSITDASNVSQIRHLRLPYFQNTISFEIAVIEYSDPRSNKYEYQLVGVDKDWVKGGMDEPKNIRYVNLPSGDYNLVVKAINSEGFVGEPTQIIRVTITPPWYATIWARIAEGLVLLSILLGFYRFRVNQINKRAEMQRLESEYKQLAAETETAVLRLQMNPHFIFNSMNSISSYILSKDIDTANDYLVRFARLMRTILNLAAKPRISISDETEFLEQYIKTEAMRFEQKFEYKIDVDDTIVPEEVFVPTMILQPFVENAIWHGLSSRQGQGIVRINFKKLGNSLVCSVEDNGKGREAAAAKGTDASHESKALEITERRLQLLSEEKGRTASLEINDLKDDAGNPIGTRVVVCLPFMDE